MNINHISQNQREMMFFLQKYIFLTRKSITWMGFISQTISRNIASLLAQGYIQQVKRCNENVYVLTAKGVTENTDFLWYSMGVRKKEKEKEAIARLRAKAFDIQKEYITTLEMTSKQRVERQLKLSMIAAMFYRYTRPKEILNILTEQERCGVKKTIPLRNKSVIEENAGSIMELTTSRELKTITNSRAGYGSRANAVIELDNGEALLIYNSMSRRMKCAYAEENKMQSMVEGIYNKKLKGNLIMGKSYKVLRDLLVRSGNLMLVGEEGFSLKESYYVIMSKDGAKQITAYVDNEREYIRKTALKQEQIERALNYVYDGIDKNGVVHYIAIELNIKELRTILNGLVLAAINEIEIYCYKWQENFLKELLGRYGKVSIKAVNREKLRRIIAEEKAK